ncbi:MAG TPA: AraC family transcriptional regulator [Gaiellaceae bacterium]|nr:AraC family transcriptional regulator [Gaiellaceae bacterium]
MTKHEPQSHWLSDTCEPLKSAAARGEVQLHARSRGPYPGEPIPEDVFPGLLSAGVWDARHDQDWGLDWHRNEGLELTFVERGHVPFSCEDEEYELVAHDLTVTRPWQPHRVGRPNVTASRLCWVIIDLGVRRPNQEWEWPPWIVLDQARLERLTRKLRGAERHVFRASDEVGRMFAELGRLLAGGRDDVPVRAALWINEMLLGLDDLLEGTDIVMDEFLSSSERTVRLFLTSLDERLHELWTVDRMAQECGLGRTRFAAYCRELTNMTPLEFLTRQRLEAACELLRSSPQARIEDVAESVGFSSSRYFATVMRRELGRTPSQMRTAAV